MCWLSEADTPLCVWLSRRPLHELVEMSVSLRTSPGGVWINERGETTVPGLYAAGDASGEAGTRGAGGRTGGFPNAHVFGRRAGLYAAQAARNMGLIEAEQDQIILEHARINGIKGRDGRSPIDVERKLREFAFENLNIIRQRVASVVPDPEGHQWRHGPGYQTYSH